MKTVVTVQDLIKSAYSRWKNVEGLCDSCGERSKLLIKTDITSVKEVVVFRLLLFSDQETVVLSKTLTAKLKQFLQQKL